MGKQSLIDGMILSSIALYSSPAIQSVDPHTPGNFPLNVSRSAADEGALHIQSLKHQISGDPMSLSVRILYETAAIATMTIAITRRQISKIIEF